MSSELERDGAPIRLMLLGEKLIAFRDSAGPGRRDGPSLPAPLRLAVPRPQRGRRYPLHLSRLEIRRRRQLRRHAERAAAPGLQAQGEGQGLSRPSSAPAWSGSTWDRRPRRRRCRRSRSSTCRRTRSASASSSATATTCRRSRARSTPRISASCTPATSIPTTSPRTSRSTTPSPTARRSTTSPMRPGARSTPATAPPDPDSTYWRFANFLFPFWIQAPNGEFDKPHACARLGAARRRPHHVLLPAGGSAAVSAQALPQPAFKDGTADRRHRTRQQAAAQHHRLARTLAHGREREQRLGHRPRRRSRATRSTAASTASTCRTRRSPRAWARSSTTRFEHLAPSDQMITRTRRRLLMAARALRDNGVLPPGVEDPERLSRRAQRLLRQRRQEPVAGGLCEAASAARASVAEPVACGGVDERHETRRVLW